MSRLSTNDPMQIPKDGADSIALLLPMLKGTSSCNQQFGFRKTDSKTTLSTASDLHAGLSDVLPSDNCIISKAQLSK